MDEECEDDVPDASECDEEMDGVLPEEAPIHEVSDKEGRLGSMLLGEVVDIGASRDEQLRGLCWSGVPAGLRAKAWRLLTGCVPAQRSRREAEALRKLTEYTHMVNTYYCSVQTDDAEMSRQISIDVKRMQPGILLFRDKTIQKICHRILYLWGLRHPASGYVQGMDAMLSPFVPVYFTELFHLDLLHKDTSEAIISRCINNSTEADLLRVESDVYWSFSDLMGHVQDFYIPAQPGVQRTSQKVEQLVKIIDPALHSYLIDLGADFLRDFMWRWATCFLVRELPLSATTRVWDTFLSEGPDAGTFLTFISVAFLLHWKPRLMSCDFNELMALLRSLPTQDVTEVQVNEWLAHGYLLQKTYSHMLAR